ncbi:MAG: DUF969 domain-containing protein [Proteobacteria bacterium]|nr:DUF969 domain-containing protein [Pseudomonadota bacterium]
MWPLLGIAVVVAGFALRLNPLLVIALAAGVTGWAGGISLHSTIAAFGHAFAQDRYVSVVFLVLPVIGLLERYGLQERARQLIASFRGATAGGLLLAYFLLRQLGAALGIPFGGQAQVVRPLLAPMLEGAAEAQTGEPLTPARRYWLRAHAAAAENIGLFFGEDIFIAIGSILLIKGFLDNDGIAVEPLALSKWAIPTAILAAIVHGIRIKLIDRTLRKPQDGAP